MSERLDFLPLPAFEPLRRELEERLKLMAAQIGARNYAHFQDQVLEQTLRQGFERAGAHEGTIWLLDPLKENLIPVFNSGPSADQFVGQFQQPLTSGLISMVLVSEQPFCENKVHENANQDKRLDDRLQLQTYAMAVVPLYFASEVQGVISCVQVFREGENLPPGFSQESLSALEDVTTVYSRLVDLKLIRLATGLDSPR